MNKRNSHGSMQEALENEIARLKAARRCYYDARKENRKIENEGCEGNGRVAMQDFRKELESEKESHAKTKIALDAAQEEIDRLRSQLKDMQKVV